MYLAEAGEGGGGCVPLTQSPKTSFPAVVTAKELDSAVPWNRLDKRNSSRGRQTVYSKDNPNTDTLLILSVPTSEAIQI